MTSREKRIPSALKHGVFSATSVLPTEDQAAFDELHRSLVADLKPCGPLAESIVARIARLTWRSGNLGTLRNARLARSRYLAIWDEIVQDRHPEQVEVFRHSESDEMARIAEPKTRQELGDAFSLIEVGRAASFEGLAEELDLEDRIGSLINKSLKQLILVQGIKSLANTTNPSLGNRSTPSLEDKSNACRTSLQKDLVDDEV